MSTAYDTEEELRDKEKIVGICECGSLISAKYGGDSGRAMAKHNCCFTCAFWLEKVEMSPSDAARRLIVGGVHHMVAPEDRNDGFRGFGGYRFKFRRLGQDNVETSTNVWYQGEIPKRFRALLPDNAEWV